jgi:hypothetical protein
MRTPFWLTSACAALVLSLASCSSTIPTAADMDRFYKKAEQMADTRIAALEEKRRRGEITDAQFEVQSAAARARIENHATELAWARHEDVEAQLRSLGIPTGGHPVPVQVPNTGGGESFYRQAGQAGGQNFYSNAPYGGSVLGGPNRGDRPSLPPVEGPGGQPEPAPEPDTGT